jgi:hypothetical protein
MPVVWRLHRKCEKAKTDYSVQDVAERGFAHGGLWLAVRVSVYG